jgi:hypothetical protein
MIEAGKLEQVRWGDGNWVFLDIGFSAKARSSGLLIADGEPKCFQFADATRQITEHVSLAKTTTNLVIEAPLSVCFNKSGNPTGRRIEKEQTQGKTKTRYWHSGLGCSVMVAATYLIRALSKAAPEGQVRLFEGFVSYKEKGTSDHCMDVRLLREVVQRPTKFAACIVSCDALRAEPEDQIFSAFKVSGFDCGVPAVIKRPAARSRS